MAELTETAVLYVSLAARDGAFAGRAFVAVSSTGIYCTMQCPSRLPLEKHCRFFEAAADCRAAGFRACKRCRPDALRC